MGRPSVKSALNPDPQPLWPGIGCSVFLHGGLGLVALVASWLTALLPSCGDRPPLIDNSVEVFSAETLPRRLNVPDKAERAPRRKKPERPAPKEPPAPEPVKESDLVVKKEAPEPEPEPEGNTDDERARQQALEELLRDEALEDLLADAPEGEVDRLPTDPDGEVGADPTVAVLGAKAQGDPAFARWKAEVVRQLRGRFKPVGSTEGLSVVMNVWFDPRSGRISRWAIGESSGVLSFDKAAERAIEAAGSIPPPPPAYEPLFDAEYVEVEMVP